MKSNPYLSAFIGIFVGTVLTQLQSAYDSGHLDFTGKGLVHMFLGAALGAGLSVYHLYLPQPQKSPTPPQTEEKK
jgi:hypothetical protein